MNHLSKFNLIADAAKRATLLACLLSPVLTANGQNDADHSGHDHAGEKAKGGSHEARAEHDAHDHDGQAGDERDGQGASKRHDPAEEKAKGESHEAHDDHRDSEEHDHAEKAAGSESRDAHGGHDDHGGEGGRGGHEEEGAVNLSPEVRREFGIELSQAGPGTLHEEVVLPGEVRFNRAAIAYATPRYEGTVQDIRVKLADRVKKGQVLATLESADTLRPFEVTAPLDGVIVSYDITPGQTVPAGTSLFTVADLSTVWADLRIYQANFGQIREGQSVRISGEHNLPTYRGTIDYVAPTVDEHTRTGLARVVVENDGRAWKPGMFIQGAVAVERHSVAIMVPRSAVLTMEDSSVVFVQTAEGFEPRPIQIGHSDSEYLEVARGLERGETYVSKNPISIKAEVGKGAFGGHQH